MTITYFVFYFLLTFAIPSIRTYKKTGVNPITFGKNDNAHNLIGFYMKIVMALIFISALETDGLLGISFNNLFENDSLKKIGLFLMISSLLWIVVAQFQMSVSWRIGIDEKTKTELRTQGLFSFSRNPIFLGMLISMAGFYCYRSSILNLILLIASYLLISIQVRLEEEFLLKQHGDKYSTFRGHVPRWLLLKSRT